MAAQRQHKAWSELSFRDKSAHVTALSSFVLGWVITIIGIFLPPLGEVDPTIISIFGMAIGYTGAMYGIITWVKQGQEAFFNKLEQKQREQQ